MKKVGEYFEVHTTMQKILKNFEELFGLQFHDIRRQDAVVWDEEALGGGFLGYLYLDLFDREGKDSGIFNCTLELVRFLGMTFECNELMIYRDI